MTCHASLILQIDKSSPKQYTSRKSVAKATVEDEFGNLLAEGEGVFVVPRSWNLVELPAGI